MITIQEIQYKVLIRDHTRELWITVIASKNLAKLITQDTISEGV